MEMPCDTDQKRKESPYMGTSRDNDQKHAYISNEMQLQNHSVTIFHKRNHFFQLPAVYPAKRCIVLDETPVHNKNILWQEWMFFFL